MKCENCGSSTYVTLVDGDWSHDYHATEQYECEICGASATYRLRRNGANQMIGPISPDK